MQDLTGKKFGRLIVLGFGYKRKRKTGGYRYYWRCQCECGNICLIDGDKLKGGHTRSCGCYAKEQVSKTKSTHRLSNSRLYEIYTTMKKRCYNPHSKNYKNYGARGINICENWLKDFMNFYNWSIANGYRENLSIDRINNNKGYSPENCRWVDMVTQQNNKTNNLKIKLNGEVHSLSDWCRIKNKNYSTVTQRIHKLKWSLEKALNTPTTKGFILNEYRC